MVDFKLMVSERNISLCCAIDDDVLKLIITGVFSDQFDGCANASYKVKKM